MGVIWIVSIIITMVIVDEKKLNSVLFFILAVATGPLAVFVALFFPSGKKNIEKATNLEDAQRQLSGVKDSLFTLHQRVNNLETLIDKLAQHTAAPEAKDNLKVEVADEQFIKEEVQAMEKEHLQEEAVIKSQHTKDSDIETKMVEPSESTTVTTHQDMEINFGRNWLNKIGMVVFTLGMGFLISYTFKYFGPFLKIAFGYAVSAATFFIGLRLETKEKFVHFGRVLLGGAWALIYFTTYAMHHFEASRLITSQLLDLCLLALVIIGMMIHVLKYKSESAMSLAIFIAYITATLGHITTFTVIYCLFLSLMVFFLVYHFEWVKTFVISILMTYGIHYIWVMPNIAASAQKDALLGNIPDYYTMMNFIFLTSYWLVFLVGNHIARRVKDSRLVDILAATNFGNIALYAVLAYPIILKLFYSHRFEIVFSIGILYLVMALVMKKIGARKFYISDIITAIFVITFSLPLKFMPTSTLLLWLIETPFLLYVGFSFKEKIYRYLSYALAVFVGLRLLFFDYYGVSDINFSGIIWTWQEFITLWAAVAMAGCFYLTKRAKKRKELDVFDEVFDQLFAAAACFYLTFLVNLKIEEPWNSLALAVEVPILLLVGFRLKEKVFRYFSYLLSVFVGFRLIFYYSDWLNNVRFLGIIWTWQEFISLWAGIAMAASFYLTQQAKKKSQASSVDEVFDHIFPAASCFYFTSLIYSIVNQPWSSFALSIEGTVLLAVSVFLALRRFRMYAYLVFAYSALVFVTRNIYAATPFLKWFIIGFDVLVFFGIYFLVKKLSRNKHINLFFDHEETLPFWAGIMLLIFAIFHYINFHWISLSLGIAGVAIIFIGILNKDKIERWGGLLLLGLTLVRVILVDLSGLDIIFKIITFIILGLLFLGISFVYNKFFIEQKDNIKRRKND